MAYVWVTLGAVLGANARYLVGVWAVERLGSTFPYGTLLINLSGSFLLGLFLGVLSQRAVPDPAWRLILAVGFCGSYTTFSTFSLEAVELARSGSWVAAGWYVVGSVVLALAATVGGLAVSRLV